MRAEYACMNRPLLLKGAVLGVLALVLLLPLGMVRDLVAERQARRTEAINGIVEGWGKRQTVGAPYIVISYERSWTEVRRETVDGKALEHRNERSEWKALKLAPSAVDWTVNAEISEKARGIYKARLYGARLQGRGSIVLPARGGLEDGSSRYRWGAPRLVLAIADPLGIRAAPDVQVAGRSYPLLPGSSDGVPGVHAMLSENLLGREQTVEFSVALELGGSEAIGLSPMGADTTVSMRADWPHPSFQGRFLPARHEITADGFSATWRVSRFAAGGAQQNEQISVSFIEPAGLYQRLERASKYGFLFVGLTFAAFVLIELLRRLAIHPIQYGLVGLALAMFFLLLTALSEHIEFAAAYGIATGACVGLITLYLVKVLQSTPLGLAFGGLLAALYGILYALLKAEDYALLGGALVLFALLAALMLATRRVDWYRHAYQGPT